MLFCAQLVRGLLFFFDVWLKLLLWLSDHFMIIVEVGVKFLQQRRGS